MSTGYDLWHAGYRDSLAELAENLRKAPPDSPEFHNRLQLIMRSCFEAGEVTEGKRQVRLDRLVMIASGLPAAHDRRMVIEPKDIATEARKILYQLEQQT